MPWTNCYSAIRHRDRITNQSSKSELHCLLSISQKPPGVGITPLTSLPGARSWNIGKSFRQGLLRTKHHHYDNLLYVLVYLGCFKVHSNILRTLAFCFDSKSDLLISLHLNNCYNLSMSMRCSIFVT